MATKAQKQLQSAKRTASNARRRQKDRMNMVVRGVAGTATGGGIAWLESRGYLDRVPTLGVPKVLLIAGGGLVGAFMARGTLREVSEGIGTGASAVAAYQRVAEGRIAGAEDSESVVEALEAELRDVGYDPAAHEYADGIA